MLNIVDFIKDHKYTKVNIDGKDFKIGRTRAEWIDCFLIGCQYGMSFPLAKEMDGAEIDKNKIFWK
jgi:hypothetical protein